MFHHVAINCIFGALFARTLTVLVLVKQFSLININVSQAHTIHMVQHFPIQLFATEEFS